MPRSGKGPLTTLLGVQGVCTAAAPRGLERRPGMRQARTLPFGRNPDVRERDQGPLGDRSGMWDAEHGAIRGWAVVVDKGVASLQPARRLEDRGWSCQT